MNRMNDSIASQQRAIALNPNSPEAYFFIAQSYDKAGSPQKALSYYRQFIDYALGQDQYKAYISTAKGRIAALSGNKS